MDIDTVAHITDAIIDTHHCSAQYLQSVRITYIYKNRILWQGHVGIFRLPDHPSSSLCYAWLNDELLGLTAPTLVLQSPAINSPNAAIHFHLTQSPQHLQHN